MSGAVWNFELGERLELQLIEPEEHTLFGDRHKQPAGKDKRRDYLDIMTTHRIDTIVPTKNGTIVLIQNPNVIWTFYLKGSSFLQYHFMINPAIRRLSQPEVFRFLMKDARSVLP